VPGAPFEPLDEETCNAHIKGVRQGLMAMYSRAQTVKSSAELFGSREQLSCSVII
jgi:hypothetical protein